MWIIVNDLAGLLIAFIAGLYALPYIKLYYKLFFYLIVVFIIIYILTYVVLLFPNQKSNQWVFNLYMPIETGFLMRAAYQYFKLDKRKSLIIVGYFVFMAVFLSDIIVRGPGIFANHGYITESILLVALYLFVLNFEFNKEFISWKRSPDIWIALGIVAYFGGAAPYLSLMHYLNTNHHTLNYYLYNLVTVGLANLRYILLAVGFWLIRRNAIAKTISTQ